MHGSNLRGNFRFGRKVDSSTYELGMGQSPEKNEKRRMSKGCLISCRKPDGCDRELISSAPKNWIDLPANLPFSLLAVAASSEAHVYFEGLDNILGDIHFTMGGLPGRKILASEVWGKKKLMNEFLSLSNSGRMRIFPNGTQRIIVNMVWNDDRREWEFIRAS